MKISEMTHEEIELLGYDDIASLILEEENTPMKINVLFEKVSKSLRLNSSEYEDKIVDFFELLTTDKRFVLLEDGSWDLKQKHPIKVIMDDDDIEDNIEIDEEDTEEEEKEDNIFYDEEETDDSDDDLKDLVIISDEEEE